MEKVSLTNYCLKTVRCFQHGMTDEKVFPRKCAICLDVPHVPKVLPCQHMYCIQCLDEYIKKRSQNSSEDDDEDNGQLLCPECRRPFCCLPMPEVGCEPIGPVHQDFPSDSFRQSAEYSGLIDDVKSKVSIVLYNARGFCG